MGGRRIGEAERAVKSGRKPGDVERGERNISLVNIVGLAKALGVKPGSLFPDTDRAP